MTRRVRGWVFDLDGTLVDTLPDLLGALNHALELHGLRASTRDEALVGLHEGLHGMVNSALATQAQPASHADRILASFSTQYDRQLSSRSRPYPGVISFLERQTIMGVRMAVCTNKPEVMARRLLSELGLSRYFSAIVGADTCPRRKPAPEPLWHAIAQLQANRQECVLVGDSEVDGLCAQAAGVPFWLFSGGYGAKEAAVHARRSFGHWDRIDGS